MNKVLAAACDLEYIGAHWNRNPLGVFVPKDLIHRVRCDPVVFQRILSNDKATIDKGVFVGHMDDLVGFLQLVSFVSYVPEQCNDEKLKKVLKVNDFRHFFS